MTATETKLKMSLFEAAEKLLKNETIELAAKETLTITNIELHDFMAIVNEEDLHKKLGLLQAAFNRLGVALVFNGDVMLGTLNLNETSWEIGAGEKKSLKISALHAPFKIAVNDLVAFLKKMPVGQGLALKSAQDLVLTGFSETSVKNYYDLSSDSKDVAVLEKLQDQFFTDASEILRSEGLTLKVFAAEATQLNREVNPAFGLIAFRAAGEEKKFPRVCVALVKNA